MKRTMITTSEQRRKKRWKSVLGWFLFLSIIGGTIYAMNQPYFFIETIYIDGNGTISTSRLTTQVEEHLEGTWLGVIPRRNFLFVGKRSLRQTLEAEHPRIYDMSIDAHHSELSIRIEEREAHSLWCVLKEYERVFDEECYFSDQRGFWYTRAPYFSDNVFHKIFIDPRVTTIMPGKSYFTGPSFDNFFVFIENVANDYDLDIRRVEIGRQGDVTMKVSRIQGVVFDEQPVILFNTKDSYEIIHRNLGIIFTQQEFIDDFKAQPQSLSSIDVRFDGRIFYRF